MTAVDSNGFEAFVLGNKSDDAFVPTVAFGTGTTFFARPDDVAKAVEEAVKVGYRLIDTAVLYKTEEGVGAAIKNLVSQGVVTRKELFVTSKLLPFDLSTQEIIDMVDQCLKRLQLDYLDCMMIHWPGTPDVAKGKPMFENVPSTPKESHEARLNMWQAFQKCREDGKIKHLGVSNFCRNHIEQMLQDSRCKVKPVLNQIEFNPYMQDQDTLAACKENGILIQAYAPIGSGTRDDGKLKLVLEDPALKKMSERLGWSVGQICLAWALRRNVCVVTKTEKLSRMVENIGAIGIAGQLSDEDLAIIDDLNINLRKFPDPHTAA